MNITDSKPPVLLSAITNTKSTVNPGVKVMIGFKCPAELKLRLSRDANSLNLTLSEFVESLLINYADIKSFNQKTQVEPEKLTQLSQQVADLNQRLGKYECSRLKQFFKKMEGKEVNFNDFSGNPLSIKVKTLTDMYDIIINSVKPTNND